jgi:hypothetical protein
MNISSRLRRAFAQRTDGCRIPRRDAFFPGLRRERFAEDAASYASLLDGMTEEKGVAVLVQRGKERLRLETKIVIPKREEALTARVQAEYFSDDNEVLVITRQIGELRLDLPEYWIPAHLNWNGNAMGTANKPGCWMLGAGTTAARPCAP